MLVANFGRYLRLISSVPQRITALITSVFCTSTSTPIDGSTRDSDSTASTEWKNVPPAPPKLSGTSTLITPSSNSFLISVGRELGVLVHLARERTDFAVRELVHAVAENRFVFGQPRQRGHGGHGLAHEILNMLLNTANTSKEAKSRRKTSMLSST